MSLPTDALDYELPERLIATRPVEPRDSARMLVVRPGGGAIEHRRVRDLPEYLAAGDTLVFNDTAVAPARLAGRRVGTGGRIEGLFLETRADGAWRVMLRSGGRLVAGDRIDLLAANGEPCGHALEIIERPVDEGGDGGGGVWTTRVDPPAPVETVLDAAGSTPIPPYILRARRDHHETVADDDDRRWYQTVYADLARRGSVAAPTAGLHFTPDLLSAIARRGVTSASVTLHVGAGTFKPITAPTVETHAMHHERYEVPAETIEMLRHPPGTAPGSAPGRIIAIGTTTVRTLESLPAVLPAAPAATISGSTDLLIAPPHEFRHVDGMLTNFHLPRSTLLALVAAMIGLDRLLDVYREAIEREYRFYSYGDAMLVLPESQEPCQ